MFHNPIADGIVVILILLLFFGPKRLPTLGRSLGEGIKEFKDGITSRSEDDAKDPPRLTQPPAAGTPAQRDSAEVGRESR